MSLPSNLPARISHPEHILFINVTRIGDTLAGTPSLAALHEHWPTAHITALGGPKRACVLEHLPGLQTTGHITKRSALWRGWLSGKRYDLAIVNNYDTALVRYALRVSHAVVAYRQNVPAIDRRLFLAVDPAAVAVSHFTDHVAHLLHPLGIDVTNRRIRFERTMTEAQEARQRLHAMGIDNGQRLIGLQVASFATKSYRDWPLENFQALAEALLAKHADTRFLLFGGPDEAERTQQLAHTLGPAAHSLAGQLSLRQTGALMGELDLYIGVDTGPTHLMSSFDHPMVALYHHRHPSSLYGPLGHPRCICIDHPYPDHPGTPPRSMGEISVDTVLAQALQLLSSPPKTS